MIINRALKEWQFICDRLLSGKQYILIRKGGIREEDGQFRIDDQRFLLMPGREHEDKQLLREEFHGILNHEEPLDPSRIVIKGWAEVKQVIKVDNTDILDNLDEYHPWNSRFMDKRLNFNPYDPLFILILRCYLLPERIMVPFLKEYGGCTSWVTFSGEVSLDGSKPVITDLEHGAFVDQFYSAGGIIRKFQSDLEKC